MNKDFHVRIYANRFFRFLYTKLIQDQLLILLVSNILLIWLFIDFTKPLLSLIAVLLNTFQIVTKSYEVISKLCTLGFSIFLTELSPPQIKYCSLIRNRYNLVFANYLYLPLIKGNVLQREIYLGFLYLFVRTIAFSGEELSHKILTASLFVLLIIRDEREEKAIYEYKRKYQDRMNKSKLWKSLCEASADGIILFSRRKISYVNEIATKIFNKKVEELLDKDINVLTKQFKQLEFEQIEESKCIQAKEKYHSNLFELISHYMSANEYLGVQNFCMSNRNQLFNIFCNSFVFRDTKHYLLSLRDITRVKDMQSSQAKSILLSSLSHELKTPLNAIIDTLKWFVQSLDNITKKGLQIAYASSLLLRNYVNNVLDYAEYTQNKKIIIKTRPTNFRSLISKVRVLFEEQIHSYKIVFSVMIEDNVPDILKLDKRKVKQILISTLGIAFRYTYQGFIFLRALYTNNTLKIFINDEGAGLPFPIDPNKLCCVLTSVDSTFCDSGINLATTQLLVNAMKGEMEIQTKMHHGTKMIITIPAEDNRSISHSVSVVGCSNSLLSQIELQRKAAIPYNNTPTYNKEVIYNHLLNDVDELSTSISIPLFNSHCWPLKKRSPKKLIVSSKTLPNKLFTDDEVRAMSSLAIDELESKRTFKCTCPKVLAVDDNVLNLLVIEGIFKRFGVTCDKAFNGSEAIKMVLRENICINCHGYDIIFMDCNMPIMNGFEASKTLNNMMARGKIKNIPIIANSAFNENDCIDKCKEAGMSSFSKFFIHNSTKTINY